MISKQWCTTAIKKTKYMCQLALYRLNAYFKCTSGCT